MILGHGHFIVFDIQFLILCSSCFESGSDSFPVPDIVDIDCGNPAELSGADGVLPHPAAGKVRKDG